MITGDIVKSKNRLSHMLQLNTMNLRNLLIIAIVVLGFNMGYAQTRLIGERSIYTQYQLTPYLLHPGAAGLEEAGQVTANYRNTYASFPGSPRTMTIGFEGALGNNIGIGVLGMTDQFAAFNTNRGGLMLSYKIESPNNKIGFGLMGEFLQHRLNSSELSNPLVNINDPEIIRRMDGNSFVDAGFGIYGIYMDKLIYGVTLPALLSTKVSGFSDDTKGDMAFIATLGYRHRIPEKDVVITPTVYAKRFMFTPFHVDVNVVASFLGESLVTGLNYTIEGEKRVGFLVGGRTGMFGFNYSYNITTHQFQTYSNGSHELGLTLRLLKPDMKEKE